MKLIQRRWEGHFGTILSEAMACGLPVISSASGSLPDVVGDAGILVHPNDPGDIASAIINLLCDDDLRRDMRVKGRERVVEEFAAEKTTEYISILLERLSLVVIS